MNKYKNLKFAETNGENPKCYDENGNFLGWFSRSVAVVGFIFCKNKQGRWCVLANKRGKGTPDPEFIECWNVTCGYCNWNETLNESIQREVLEECGVNIAPSEFEFEEFNSDPDGDKRQNITARFTCIMVDVNCEDFTLGPKGGEKNETSEVKWIELNDVQNYNWAFNHDNLIKRFARMYNL